MLKYDIGLNAGTIWGILQENGIMPIDKIEELTLYKNSDICLALGWLCRENKVRFVMKEGVLNAELVYIHSESYY